MDTTVAVCFVSGGGGAGFSWLRTVPKTKPLLSLFFPNKNKRGKKKSTSFIYAKTIQQHQANEPTGSSSTPASTIGIQAGGGASASHSPCAALPPRWGVLGTTAAIFFVRPLHPRYVKKQVKDGEREYIYTFVQKRHMN